VNKFARCAEGTSFGRAVHAAVDFPEAPFFSSPAIFEIEQSPATAVAVPFDEVSPRGSC
jgi:hypothetical protein